MPTLSRLAALAAQVSSVLAVAQGFNYGNTFTSGAAKMQQDFEDEFNAAQGLVGAPAGGFASARLYTMVQAGTTNDPIQAIPAAIATKTTLLLGLWCSGGDATFANELAALNAAIKNWGSSFPSLVVGISVGSEDLYRISPTGIENKSPPGAQPDTIVGYISQVRNALSSAGISVPVGHVDTWTAWVNGSNDAVLDACDFLGLDAYPYFQTSEVNAIADGKSLFNAAFSATQGAASGKAVWVTETGWPVSGNTSNLAVPSLANAQTYWDQVGCPLFGTTNTWWYTLQDAEPDLPNPSFGIIGSTLNTTPLFNLTCNGVNEGSSPPPAASSSSSSTSGPSGSGSSSSTTSFPAGTGTTTSPESTPAPQAGGSPGGVPSSQLSKEGDTLTNSRSTSTTASPSSSSTGGSGSGSGSGSSSTTSASGTKSTGSTTPNAAAATAGPVGSALLVAMAAALAL